jgi:hypothetical protein
MEACSRKVVTPTNQSAIGPHSPEAIVSRSYVFMQPITKESRTREQKRADGGKVLVIHDS